MVLDQIPFEPDVNELISQLRLDPNDELCAEVRELVGLAAQEARPKAMVKEVFISAHGQNTVTIEDVTFTSQVLATNLKDVERVFAYVATCGTELDTLRSRFSDPVLAYCLDCVKSAALQAARKRLKSYVVSQYGIDKIASMNPGSGDVDVWPIEQQAELFKLLGDTVTQLGVRLTEAYLMEPNKTVSGILFPTEKGFVTCQLCHRNNCPGRQAPFDAQLWHERQQLSAQLSAQ